MQPLGWLRNELCEHMKLSRWFNTSGRKSERKSIELIRLANVFTKRVTTELIGIKAAVEAVVTVAVARRMAILNQFHTNCLHIAQISNDLWAVIWVFSFVLNDSWWPSLACSIFELQQIYTLLSSSTLLPWFAFANNSIVFINLLFIIIQYRNDFELPFGIIGRKRAKKYTRLTKTSSFTSLD